MPDQAFEILIRQHHRRLLAYAISVTHNEHVAQDLVQDAFLTAHAKLDSFDTTRDFGAWMRGIVRNKYKEWVRKQSAYTPLNDELLDSLEDEFSRIDDAAGVEVDLMKALRGCLQKLPDLLYKAVDLFYLGSKSGREVADALDVKEAVVRKRLQRAREQLAGCISLEVTHG